MSWRCVVKDEALGFGVKIAIADVTQYGGVMLHFEPVTSKEFQRVAEPPDDAWLTLPRDAAVALMLELQQQLAPDRRSVDREVLERADEALAVERARVDKILDRDPRVIISDGTGGQV